MKGQAIVFASGARTPIGLDATQTALLLRTGIPALGASPLAASDGSALVMAFDATQDPKLVGEERAARLAHAALTEVATKLGSQARSLRLRVALAFTETGPGERKHEVLATRVRTALREAFGDPHVDLSLGGAAGLASILPAAFTALAARAVDAVLVGGIHSDYDPHRIVALDVARRLFSPERVDGVIPGESAAFVLLGRDDLASITGLRPLCRIHAVATEQSGITPHGDASSFDASALSSVIRKASSVLPEGLQAGWLIADHTYEQFRVRELFAALARTRESFCPPISLDAPAQRIGLLGAAALPLGLLLSADMFQRGYAPTPFGMLLAGNDDGLRASMLVGSP